MDRTRNSAGKMAGLLLLALCLALPGFAQFSARVEGEVRDSKGAVFPDVTVSLKNQDRGQSLEVKTDRNGRYAASNLTPGIWVLVFKAKAPDGREITIHEGRLRLGSTSDERYNVNIKELLEKMGAEEKEARKKQEEEKAKFDSMKVHFDTGRAALDQLRAVRQEIARTPAAERAPLQEKATELAKTAVTELEQAQAAVDAKDANFHIVQANLGEAYEEAGRYEEAVGAYGRALEASPQTGPYYVKLGTVQARSGKVSDAMASCEKGAAVDPSQSATCWRNVSIILYNASKLKEAVEPLKRATALDPQNADQWYLLGASLLASMEFKNEGGKIITIPMPGTAEAYQKYLELAPSGRFAADAKAALDALAAMGQGIDTKVSTRSKAKKKSN